MSKTPRPSPALPPLRFLVVTHEGSIWDDREKADRRTYHEDPPRLQYLAGDTWKDVPFVREPVEKHRGKLLVDPRLERGDFVFAWAIKTSRGEIAKKGKIFNVLEIERIRKEWAIDPQSVFIDSGFQTENVRHWCAQWGWQSVKGIRRGTGGRIEPEIAAEIEEATADL